MIKRPNKYIYGIIISTALSSSSVFAIENTVKDSKEVNINKDNNEISILASAPIDIESAKQELQEAIDLAKQRYDDASFGDREGQYPIEAGAVLNAARNEAIAVLDESSSTLQDLIDAKLKLEDAIAEFLKSKISISELKAELLKLIDEVTELHNTAQVGYEIGEYTEEAKENLFNAISVAESVHNGPNDKASVIEKAMEELNKSKEMFLNSANSEIDVSGLIAKITELENFAQNVVVGENPGMYPQSQKEIFDAAIIEAQSLVGNCTYKQAQDMIVNLDKAKSDLENSLIEYDDIIRTELEEQIRIAEALLEGEDKDKDVVGPDIGQYTQESFNNLHSVVNDAKIKYGDYLASQKDIDSKVAKLKAAITEFKESVRKKFDTSKLEELIVLAEKLTKERTEGDRIDQVPEGEMAKLIEKIKEATEKRDLEFATKDDICGAYNDLKQAMDNFINSIIKKADEEILSDLSNKIDEAVKLIESIADNESEQYPQLAKDNLNKVIIKAKETLQSDTATQKDVNDMIESLNKAIADFQNSKIQAIIDKLEDAIEKAEQIIKSSVVGDKDGMYPKDTYDKLKDAIDSAKSTLESTHPTEDIIKSKKSELEAAIETFLKSENVKYKDYRAELEVKINDYIDVCNSAKEGESVGEYPTEVKNDFYKAIEKAKAVLLKNSKVSEDYIKALDDLEKAKIDFDNGAITGEDIELYLAKMQVLLKQISDKIKDADTSSELNRVPENKKIALSVMFNRISQIGEDTQNLSDIKEGIKLAEYAISDFNDRSIYIDNKNVVHGRKLTGKVGSNNTNRENVNIVDKKEFIPKAGMPIDIKGALASVGVAFIGISGAMFKRKK